MTNVKNKKPSNNFNRQKRVIIDTEKLTDFELDLTIVEDYIFEAIPNIEDAKTSKVAEQLLDQYDNSKETLEQASCVINLLVILLEEFAFRCQQYQHTLHKQLKKITSSVKNDKGNKLGEFGLINDLRKNLGINII